jgi:hypothetical protein
VTGLNAKIAIDITNVPYLSYDSVNDHYKMTAYGPSYKETLSTPIKIWFNEPLNNFLKTMPIKYVSATFPTPITEYRFVFNQTATNTVGNLITLEQESMTLQNYADPRQLIITTSMPITSEVFPNTGGTSGQLYSPILQSYIFNYTDGIQGFNSTLDWYSVTNNFRAIKMTSTDIYTIKCNVYYLTRDGTRRTFNLPAFSSVNLLLEFRE